MSTENLKNSPKVLGLDISTKTIGWSLFDIQSQKLLELTHFSPVIKPKLSTSNIIITQVSDNTKDHPNIP